MNARPAISENQALLEAVEALRGEVCALRGEVSALRGDLRLRLPPAGIDAESLIRAMAEMAEEVGDFLFNARELVRYAADHLESPLHAALGDCKAHRLAKFLRRIEGQALAGYRIVRARKDRDGILWQLAVL